MHKVLVIDDKLETLRDGVEEALDRYERLYATSGREGLKIIEADPEVAAVLLDIKMEPDYAEIEDREGVEVLKRVKELRPDLPVIMTTVVTDTDMIVETIREGAFHYLVKPLDIEKLRALVAKALENAELRRKVDNMQRTIDARNLVEGVRVAAEPRQSFGSLIGASEAMQELYAKMERVAGLDMAVLIMGETGSGKELVAREIHATSKRAGGPFVPVNCAAIPRELLESEFFGHVKGAFTGAISDKKGYFEQAEGGTIFLDEIGDMGLLLQGKILRVLDEKRVTPVGAAKSMAIDVRVISATNKDLLEQRKKGAFRDDLYYRLTEIPLRVPSLRVRKEDIPLLANYFLEEWNRESGTHHSFSERALQKLANHSWVGNVRELSNTVRWTLGSASKQVIDENDIAFETEENALQVSETSELWEGIVEGRLPISDITKFRNKYGEEVLKNILIRAIRQTRDVREAGILIGYIQDDQDNQRYDSLRQWMKRLGISKREALR